MFMELWNLGAMFIRKDKQNVNPLQYIFAY